MNILEVKAWMDMMEYDRWSTLGMDEKSEKLLVELFKVTEKIEAVGTDDRKEFWIRVDRGTPAEYYVRNELLYWEEDKEPDMERVKKDFLSNYPEEYEWVHFMSLHHKMTGSDEEFYGVFLNGNYILSKNDRNQRAGYDVDASELISWLIESAREVVRKLENGKYNEYIGKNLPMKHRSGSIARKDYWDIWPELRENYLSELKEHEIKEFLSYAEEFSIEDNDWSPVYKVPSMTARDFYEACGIIYSVLDLKERFIFFEEAPEERERYGGTTPKELYYMHADGRDNGLKNVPMDDPEEFMLWHEEKGDYYEFNGRHPWEIVPSGSVSRSMHLGVAYGDEMYFILSGGWIGRSTDTIKAYVALRKANLPVLLINGKGIAARLKETDEILILPERYDSYRTWTGDTDSINLFECNKPEKVIEKATWKPEKTVRLKTMEQ